VSGRAGASGPAGATGPARRSATRERVFSAAVELIAERGYAGTTVDEIAAAAGVAKGTVFYNFGTKEQLFEGLLRDGVDRLTAGFREAIAGLHGLAALDALVRAELERAAANPAFAQIFLTELYRAGRAARPTLTRLRAEVAGVLTEVIADGQRRGEMDPAVDAGFAAGALLGAVVVVALDWLTYAPERSLDDVHAAAVRMVRGSLAR
jgi:AcrR family transcriptional regulator